MSITFNYDPELDQAVELINANWCEGFDREHAVRLLKQHGLAPRLQRALSESTFEEWEDFIVNYLGE